MKNLLFCLLVATPFLAFADVPEAGMGEQANAVAWFASQIAEGPRTLAITFQDMIAISESQGFVRTETKLFIGAAEEKRFVYRVKLQGPNNKTRFLRAIGSYEVGSDRRFKDAYILESHMCDGDGCTY